MQDKVKSFNDKIGHREPMTVYARILDIESEIGELAKEYLKSSGYGNKEFEMTEDFKEEFGDVLYALISFSNEMDISCDECLDVALNKLKSRMDKNNSFGSGR